MSQTYIFLVVSLGVLMHNLESSQATSETPSPIVILPGLMGSQLSSKHSGSWIPGCNTGGEYRLLWVNKKRFSVLNAGCTYIELMLNYNPATNFYGPVYEGIDIKVPGPFGETTPVEFLETEKGTPYMNILVDYFVARGYERGKSIHAAPYDWRLAPDMLEKKGYYGNLKKLIEDTYTTNGETKVTLVVHSMGGPVSLHFLTGFKPVTQEWKDKYINAWVTLSGAWSGGNKALQALISGRNVGGVSKLIDKYANYVTGPIARTFASAILLLPRESVWGDTALVTTPTQSYSAKEYERLFSDSAFFGGYTRYERILTINPGFPAPNVKTYCYYGVGVDTPEKFHYDVELKGHGTSFGETPTVIDGDGDGTVNTKSSEICLKWKDMTSHQFSAKQFEGINHGEIVEDTKVLDDIAEIVGVSSVSAMTYKSALMQLIRTFIQRNMH